MSLNQAIAAFESISLKQMDGVKLMNRTDRKFWFNASHLEELLRSVTDHYYILDIEGERNQPYQTTYFDTPTDEMYTNHHRGKLNRYKIRRRCYLATKDSFLEIKFKSNKGRTIKKRIDSDFDRKGFNEAENDFLSSLSPYCAADLSPSLTNSFRRLMLVSKDMHERCTIDQELTFMSNGCQIPLSQMVIVEVKCQGRAKSEIIEAMARRRLKPAGFSKYCIGRSITNNNLKQNHFKLRLKLIEREIGSPLSELITAI